MEIGGPPPKMDFAHHFVFEVVLPQVFLALVGAAHFRDKKAHKWSYFILWANKSVFWLLRKPPKISDKFWPINTAPPAWPSVGGT